MGSSVELRTSSRQQQSSKAVKQRFISPPASQDLKFQDKHQVENKTGQLYSEKHHTIADSLPVGQPSPSGSNRKQWSGTDRKDDELVKHMSHLPGSGTDRKDDELVKHMSHLPGYLQQIEKGENLQEKALNFGVLDWKLLERWTHSDKLVPEKGNIKASSPISSFMGGGSLKFSSLAKNKTFTSQKKNFSSHSWHLNSAYEERNGVRPQKVTKPQGFETAPWTAMDGNRNIQRSSKSSGREYFEINLDRGKKKESDHKKPSKKETMCIKYYETNTASDEEFDDARLSFGQENIVLLFPKNSSRKSFSESKLEKSRNSFDGNLAESIGRRFSGRFSAEELLPFECCCEVPYSCPLPSTVASNIEPNMEQCSSVNSQTVEFQFDASRIHQRSEEIPPLPSKIKCLEESSSNIETSTTTDTWRCSQEVSEQPSTRGRHPSPSRRFSFSSIGRMTRSFSFQENSTTVKSGSVGSSTSADFHKFSRDNASAGSRSRSSPLRRLLDPLLKPRGVHSVESSKVNFNTTSCQLITASELIQNHNSETSNIQALLQLTLRNGLPLFKLVVDNSTDILAAAIKKWPTPEEDVSSLIYSLYSAHKVKKKSGNWTHGSKGKNSSLGYNTIGKMKISPSHLADTIEQNTKDNFVVRESVLYGVDVIQGDKETPKFMPSREFAAIVIKCPTATNNIREQIDSSNRSSEDRFMEYLLNNSSGGRENEVSNSTKVILPSGIHGLPNEGLPSPLIKRWRSGGSCDCGGWDVGCKLQILSNQDQNSNNSEPSVSHSTEECLNLFVEGGGSKEKKPIFSLVPFKSEVYSVEFNPSISLLQAFFICVTFLTSQKLSHLFQVKLDEKSSHKLTTNTTKTPTTIQGHLVSTKYVTNPPPSPVGRV